MSARVKGSRRALRYEVYALISVLAVPFAIALVFPYAAIGFKAKGEKPRPPSSCAFVRLTEAQEAEAIARARSAWKVRPNGVRNLWVDLSEEELPIDEIGGVLELNTNYRPPAIAPRPFDAALLPPSIITPAVIPLEKGDSAPDAGAAFPRADLLNID